MARVKLTYDPKGNAPKTFKQGETNTNVTVDATIGGGVDIKGFEKAVWQTGCGLMALHQSKKVEGAPAGYKGYIHGSANRLFAVTRLDTAKKTLEIAKQGKVSDGVHVFK